MKYTNWGCRESGRRWLVDSSGGIDSGTEARKSSKTLHITGKPNTPTKCLGSDATHECIPMAHPCLRECSPSSRSKISKGIFCLRKAWAKVKPPIPAPTIKMRSADIADSSGVAQYALAEVSDNWRDIQETSLIYTLFSSWINQPT